MPRENCLARAARLTRSGRRDPLQETIVYLQETIKKMGRQLCRDEKTLEEINLEFQDLKEQLEEQIQATSERALHIRNRELELQVTNLRNRICLLEDLLLEVDTTAPPPLDRTFSFLD